jgi:hypothetical protein
MSAATEDMHLGVANEKGMGRMIAREVGRPTGEGQIILTIIAREPTGKPGIVQQARVMAALDEPEPAAQERKGDYSTGAVCLAQV